MLALLPPQLASSCERVWEKPATRKARRITYHVVRGAKKFVFGTGNAAWVVGTSMLVMVMPLVCEIDREQQQIEMETMQGIQGGAMKL